MSSNDPHSPVPQMQAAPDVDIPQDSTEEGVVYAFKPSLVGPPHFFRVMPDALEWEVGRRAGRIPYADIRHVRMLYRPANMQSYRFLTEVSAVGAPHFKIASVSWRSVAEQTRQDAPYRAFVEALHKHIIASGAQPVFQAGSPAWIYWPGVVVFLGLAAVMLVLIGRAMLDGAWGGAALVTAFLAFYLWKIGLFFRRNQPAPYSPDALPEALLPRR